MRLRTKRSLPRRARSGATLVETAFTLIIFMVLLMAIFEYGRYMMIRQLMENAAREGARIAVVNTNQPNYDIVTPVQNKLAGQVSSATVQVYKADPNTGSNVGNWYDAGYGEPIAVQVDAPFTPIFLGRIFSSGFTVSVKSMMRSEAN